MRSVGVDYGLVVSAVKGSDETEEIGIELTGKRAFGWLVLGFLRLGFGLRGLVMVLLSENGPTVGDRFL